VLQYLVEDLRRREPAPQLVRYRRQHGVVDLLEPPVRRNGLRHRPAALLLLVAAEAGDVVEQPPGLILVRADPGLPEQLGAVLPRLGHLGPYPQFVAVRRADQLQLVGVEPEVVEPAQPLRDPVALLLRAQLLLPGQLVPEPVVAAAQLLTEGQRVNLRRQQPARLEVEQFPAGPLGGEFHVPEPLPARQGRMLLAGLRVDQVGRERPGVIAEQRVRQRAVTPEEPGQVQPDQELHQRVEQPVGRLPDPRAGEQGTVSGRVLKEPGHQDRVQVRPPVDHDADNLDRGHVKLGERAQQPVLAPGQPLAYRLQRVEHAAVGDEADHVPRQPALPDLDQPLVLPFLKRLAEGQGQQARRIVGGRTEDKPHETTPPPADLAPPGSPLN